MRTLENRQRRQAEELMVLPLADLDEGSVHLLLGSLGFNVSFDVIDSNGIDGAELQAMSEPELFSMLELATVGELKRLSQALRNHGQGEQKAAVGPRGWSISRVGTWAKEEGMSSQVCQALKTHQINGCALMGLNRQDMLLLEIGSLNDRRKLLSQVDQLKKQDMSEVTFDVPSGAAPLPRTSDCARKQQRYLEIS